MGKYSLENYEIYKAHKARPKPIKEVLSNPGKGIYTRIVLPWSKMEEKPGIYQMEWIDEVLRQSENPVIMIDSEKPEWVNSHEDRCFSKLIRRVGSYIKDKYGLVGVVASNVYGTHYEWDSYAESFHVPVLAPLEHEELVGYYQRIGFQFGLYIEGDNSNWITCCERMGRYHLSNVWEKKPVVIHVRETQDADEFLAQAIRWHASFTNVDAAYGYQIELRRLLYPKEVSSNGYLPLRFWFVNVGSGLCYQPYELKLRLRNKTSSYIMQLNTTADQWDIDDFTYHEILKLPPMEEGVYEVAIGLFQEERNIALAIDSGQQDGFYQIGRIKVDQHDRTMLSNIWDHYYPEGYYPLEDPKEPNA